MSLGESGPVDFTMDDWAAGMQSVVEGIKYRGTPGYVSSRGTDASFPGQVILMPYAATQSLTTTHALASGAKGLKQVDFLGAIYIGFEGDRYIRKIDSGGTVTEVLDLG